MNRGEIWIAKWPTDPHAKPRPVLIVSNNMKNSHRRIHDINVVKITSFHRANGRPKAVNRAEDIVFQLKKESIIRCGSLYTIEKSLLKKKISRLSQKEMAFVDSCLRNVLAL